MFRVRSKTDQSTVDAADLFEPQKVALRIVTVSIEPPKMLGLIWLVIMKRSRQLSGFQFTFIKSTMPRMTIAKVLFAIAVVVLIAGCNRDEQNDSIPDMPINPSPFSDKNTYVIHSANRYFSGSGSLPSESTRLQFSRADQNIKWVIASSEFGPDIAWAVVRDDGTWSTFRGGEDDVPKLSTSSPLEEHELLPVLIEDERRGLRLNINAVSNPVDLELAAVLSDVENVPDGSTVRGAGSILYSYSGPTDRYPHGALGDKTEWSQLAVSSEEPGFGGDVFELSADEVFEGLFPLVADLDGDGQQEIITTVSHPSNGARLVAFKLESDKLVKIAESEPVGTGFRWLHQIAVAPFDPAGEIEIAVVETPHVGGLAKFYKLDGDKLVLTASEAGGYMSHLNGSRNLDQAVAGDFDGDGSVELLVPSRDQQTLIALRRVEDSIEEVWRLELGSRLSSNLTVAETSDGGFVIGAGTEDGILHIWE